MLSRTSAAASLPMTTRLYLPRSLGWTASISASIPQMAETSRDMTVRRLAWMPDWHVREECYVAALGQTD